MPHTRGREVTGELELPAKALDANALRTLATTMDRLAGFLEQSPGYADAPCLTDVIVEHGTVIARVVSGALRYKLELVRGAWEFR